MANRTETKTEVHTAITQTGDGEVHAASQSERRKSIFESDRVLTAAKNLLNAIAQEREEIESSQEAEEPDSSFTISFEPSIIDYVWSEEEDMPNEPYGIFANFSAFQAKIPEILETMTAYRSDNTFDIDIDAFLFPENQETGDIGGYRVESGFVGDPTRGVGETVYKIILAFGKHVPVTSEQKAVSLLSEPDFGEAYQSSDSSEETEYFGYKLNDEHHLRMYRTRVRREDGELKDYWKVILLSELGEEEATNLQERTKNVILSDIHETFTRRHLEQEKAEQAATGLGSIPGLFPDSTVPELYYGYISAQDIAEYFGMQEFVPKKVGINSDKPSIFYKNPDNLYLRDTPAELTLYEVRVQQILALLEQYHFRDNLEAHIQQSLSESESGDIVDIDPNTLFSTLLPQMDSDSIDVLINLYKIEYLGITDKYVPKPVQRVLEKLYVAWVRGELDVQSAAIRHRVEEKDGMLYYWKVGIDPFEVTGAQFVLSRQTL